VLELTLGAPAGRAATGAGGGSVAVNRRHSVLDAPDFEAVSLCSSDGGGMGLAHFIYMPSKPGSSRVASGRLPLEPGVKSCCSCGGVGSRYIHESNWRLLLARVDGL